MGLKILGTGSGIPKKIMTNDQLSEIVDTNDEWIVSHTGIHARHLLDTGESILSYAEQAAAAALENAGVAASELDLIICATLGGEILTPSAACLIQRAVGASCIAFDINAACPGFIYALETAEAFFAKGGYEKALLVACDSMSRLVNWEDRATCVLFGDAAGAAVVEKDENSLASILSAKGEFDMLNVADRGEGRPVVHMNGPAVYRFAVTSACRDIPKALAKAGISSGEVDHVILHQANLRIIDAVIDKLDIPREKYAVNVEEFGNTSASTLPVTLDKLNRAGDLKRGDIIVLCAFGGGLTTGKYVFRW